MGRHIKIPGPEAQTRIEIRTSLEFHRGSSFRLARTVVCSNRDLVDQFARVFRIGVDFHIASRFAQDGIVDQGRVGWPVYEGRVVHRKAGHHDATLADQAFGDESLEIFDPGTTRIDLPLEDRNRFVGFQWNRLVGKMVTQAPGIPIVEQKELVWRKLAGEGVLDRCIGFEERGFDPGDRIGTIDDDGPSEMEPIEDRILLVLRQNAQRHIVQNDMRDTGHGKQLRWNRFGHLFF